MSHAPFIHDRFADCHYCQKRSYSSRAAAKRAINRLHPGEHKQPYRCPVTPQQWHIGQLDGRVARGEISKTERYGEVA
jgi:hypothetical protein